MATITEVDPDIEDLCKSIEKNSTKKEPVHKLVLFNDDHHGMEEVVFQIMKAIKCNASKALQIMKEAHTLGRAIVKSGSLSECKKAENILREIDLRTTIESE